MLSRKQRRGPQSPLASAQPSFAQGDLRPSLDGMGDSREIVRLGYDVCARKYAASRDRFRSEWHLENLARHLAEGSDILDLGCGSGQPIDAFLIARGFHVTGVDFSKEQIRLASGALPAGTFIQSDMSEVTFPPETFDAVVSFHAIFHVPRDEHAALLLRASTFLRPGGYLLVTMGANDWEGTEEDFHGVRMFWSHYGSQMNLQLIREAGFTVLSGEIHSAGDEQHLVVLAQKHT